MDHDDKKDEDRYFRATKESSLNLAEVEWSNKVQQVGDPTHTGRECLM